MLKLKRKNKKRGGCKPLRGGRGAFFYTSFRYKKAISISALICYRRCAIIIVLFYKEREAHMNNYYRNLIANEFRNCVNRTIERIRTKEQTYRPFHSALLSEKVIFWSAFERSFSTSFGQRVIEEIARLVALSNGAEDARRQKVTTIFIDQAHEEAIHNHMQELRSNRNNASHSWEDTLSSIRNIEPIGQMRNIRIISDLWWKKDGIDNYISLKTVKPNIDQTAVAKEDCLHLKIALPTCNAYFGLPYNPYGERREDYAFNPPMGIFDFHHDPLVLIGRDLWDTIGGAGCYLELLDIANIIGNETKETLQKIVNEHIL